MPVPKYTYFSPADAQRSSRLQFKAKTLVEGVMTGLHKSPNRGFSVEFSEHREYVPGDELRHLDWRALARSGRHYIKLFEQETNLRAMLVLDASKSMNFGNKLDFAKHLAACVAYVLANQQDSVGLFTADAKEPLHLEPSSSPAHIDRLFRSLETIQPGNQSTLPAQLHTLSEQLPRRSVVFIVSDLWTDENELRRSLQHLRRKKHHVIMLHLIDQREVELPFSNHVRLEDLETGEAIDADLESLRDSYRENIDAYFAKVRRSCAESSVDYHRIEVSEPFEQVLIRLLNR